jgi:hypothetical protein
MWRKFLSTTLWTNIPPHNAAKWGVGRKVGGFNAENLYNSNRKSEMPHAEFASPSHVTGCCSGFSSVFIV